MPPNKPEKNYWAIKSAVGSLFKAVTLSTDPAQTLSFSSSLINTTRAFLIQKLEERVPDSEQIPSAMKSVLMSTINHWNGTILEPEGVLEIEKAMGEIFKTPSTARYGIEIYRDILFCDELLDRWKEANRIYIESNAAWIISNSYLSDINKQLMEIIVRHDMMTFPKGDVFSLDSTGNTISDMMKQTTES